MPIKNLDCSCKRFYRRHVSDYPLYIFTGGHCTLGPDSLIFSFSSGASPAHNAGGGVYEWCCAVDRYIDVIAWFAVVFGINSTRNAEIFVQGAAEYNLLHYECN